MHNYTRLSRSLALLGSAVCAAACSGGGAQEPPSGGNPTYSVSLSASPSSINNGATSVLSWSSTNTTSCIASGGWSGTKSTTGTEITAALTQTTAFTLSCSGPGGSAQQTAQVTVAAVNPAPSVSLTANGSTITAGQSSTLTWSSTNAATCTASNGWSGSKTLTGTQSVSPTTTTSYTLACTGAGGTAQQTAQVTVNAVTPAPTVTLTATPPSIVVNSTSMLTWSTTNATACTASGGWSGSKTTTGTQQVGPLATATDFILTCTGPGGSVNTTTNVAVTGSGGGSSIVGAVDSVHIDLNGMNRVYVFNGNVTPRDYRGTAGDPVASVAVTQNNNACTFGFTSATLAPGTYTVAFTSQAQNDIPTATDALTFVGTTQVTVGASPATSNFAAPTILRVGSGRTYTTVAAAAAAATSGSVIEVDAGTYNNDIVTWGTNNIVVRGIGGLAHIRGTANIGNGKGLWVTQNSRMRVENMEFSGATVTDENGAGLRGEGSNLTVCNSSFHDNENGILADDNGTLTIEYSTFANNGFGDGFTHNLYIGGSTPKLVFRHNYSHHAKIGHTLKSRARENHILYNRIMDEADGTSSYVIDIPNGGLAFVVGNLLQQGPNTDNSIIVAYGQEGLQSNRTHNFYLIDNTIVNDHSSGAFVASNGSTVVFNSTNNIFVGPGSLYSGKTPTTAITNLQTSTPGLVDRAGYDYRLVSSSAAINAGTSVGVADGFSLTPVYEYVHPARRQLRATDASIDIGAYEYR